MKTKQESPLERDNSSILNIYDTHTKSNPKFKSYKAAVNGKIEYIVINQSNEVVNLTGDDRLTVTEKVYEVFQPELDLEIINLLKLIKIVPNPYSNNSWSKDPETKLKIFNPIKQTKYMKNTQALESDDKNLFIKASDIMLKDDAEFFRYWQANAIFGDNPSIAIPYIYSDTISGTGKTAFTVKVTEKILGDMVSVVKYSDLISGYGDYFEGKRVTIVDDLAVNKSQFNNAIGVLKNMANNTNQSLNKKYGKITTVKKSVNLAITSNQAPLKMDFGQRRVVVMHVTDVLDDIEELEIIRDATETDEYSNVLQDYFNHLKYLYENMSNEMKRRLFYRPVTQVQAINQSVNANDIVNAIQNNNLSLVEDYVSDKDMLNILRFIKMQTFIDEKDGTVKTYISLTFIAYIYSVLVCKDFTIVSIQKECRSHVEKIFDIGKGIKEKFQHFRKKKELKKHDVASKIKDLDLQSMIIRGVYINDIKIDIYDKLITGLTQKIAKNNSEMYK